MNADTRRSRIGMYLRSSAVSILFLDLRIKKSESIIMLSWGEFAGGRVSRWHRREVSFEHGHRPEPEDVEPRTALHCGDPGLSRTLLYSLRVGQNHRIQP